jgi:lipoate-protein ligase A
MAVDEWMLEQAVTTENCLLRWYQWSEPTISLGYFQREAERQGEDPALRSLPHVRRLTGGGAILHHHELTYACAIPASHPLARHPRKLYDQVHRQVIETLQPGSLGLRLRGATDATRQGQFLCFGRADEHDVVLQEHKVLGSAQRRRKGAILQHGSLVLRRSELAPQFPGIFNLEIPEIPRAELQTSLTEALARLLGLPLSSEITELSPVEELRIRELAVQSAAR